MELKLNLATATLKDAEHALFLIGAYFGLTEAVVRDVRVSVPAQDLPARGPTMTFDKPPHEGGQLVPIPTTPPAPTFAPVAPPVVDPAAVFGAPPAPMTPDPAAVFGGVVGNGQSPAPVAPQGTPATPTPPLATAAPSAPIAAAPVGLPAAPAPAPVASALPGVELDADGLPWDVRINASGDGGAKPKNKDGRWRSKRGLNDGALVARVQAELRQTLAAGQALAPQAPVAPVAPTPPAAPVAPPTPPQAPAAPVGPPQTFEQLMPRVTKAMQDNLLPQGALLQAVTAYNVPNIPALANAPQLVPTIWAYLTAMYPAIV